MFLRKEADQINAGGCYKYPPQPEKTFFLRVFYKGRLTDKNNNMTSNSLQDPTGLATYNRLSGQAIELGKIRL